jgi:hypothetical protein
MEETRERGLWVGEPEYMTKPREQDPREMISPDTLGEINRFANKIYNELDMPSRAVIAKRIAWKVAPKIDLDGDIPVDYVGSFLDPFSPSTDDLTAAEQVRDELLYEFPTTKEGVNPSHKNASIRVTVSNMFQPNNSSQKQVFNAKDADGKTVKVTIWKNSDGDQNGPDSPPFGLLSWNLNSSLPAISEGDELLIMGAKPSPYRDTINITATTDTDIIKFGRGDGETVAYKPPITEESGPSEELREQMQSTPRADYVVPRTIES